MNIEEVTKITEIKRLEDLLIVMERNKGNKYGSHAYKAFKAVVTTRIKILKCKTLSHCKTLNFIGWGRENDMD